MRWNRNCRDLNLIVLAVLLFLAAVFAPIKQRSLECIGPQKLSDRVLLLDAGHGGEDGGAVSVTGKPESGINLAIVLRLDALCGFFGVNTILTRQNDTSLKDKTSKTLAQMKRTDLNNRVKLVNSQQNAILISIHQNFFFGSNNTGSQVFFAPTEGSELLALRCQQILVQKLDPSNHRQAKKISSDIYLMNHVICPAILVECGFLSNQAEAHKLEEAGYQTKLAAAILTSYLTFSPS